MSWEEALEDLSLKQQFGGFMVQEAAVCAWSR